MQLEFTSTPTSLFFFEVEAAKDLLIILEEKGV